MIRRLLPILGITFIDIVGFSIMIPLLPLFVVHFHARPIVVGILMSVFSVCQLVAGPLWGNISDRVGRKAVLIISQIGATIGWALLAFSPNLMWVFISRIIEGTSGGNIGITQAYVVDLVTPKERSRAFGMISATFGAGMIFGPLIGGFVSNTKYGFTGAFLAAAALQFLTLLLTIVLLPESRSKTAERGLVGASAIVQTFEDRKLTFLLVQKLALALALYGWFAVIALFLQAQIHLTPSQTSYYYSLFAVVNVLVNVFLVGRASDRFGDRGMSNVGLASLVCAFALVPFAHTVAAMVGVLLFFSVGMSFANTGLTAIISNASSDARQGTVLGVTSSLDSFAGIVAPPISTGLLGRYGSPFSTIASLGFAAVSFALGLVQTKRQEIPKATGAVAAPVDGPAEVEV
ncbi:MAG: MFS transporter [Candidatus Eremiobacteraeota bacterium]|nr:MFS transporter [Candidatus Eremiobacteraeota bacterium]